MNYIKLNDNTNHLSLGNIFNIIKKNSINKSSAIQTEIFCTIFSVDNISDTTVNNYCTGYRAIGNEYKQIYLNYKKQYQKDRTVLLEIINNIISIMEGTIHNYKTIKEINTNKLLIVLTQNTYSIAKNDKYFSELRKAKDLKLLQENNFYDVFIDMVFFAILEKKQPLYESDLIDDTIEDILKNTNISVNNLKEYLEMIFKEGISLIPSLKKLARRNNPYALFELGNLEYNGIITGTPNYEAAYRYHLQAASYNHPTSYWMLAQMILHDKVILFDKNRTVIAWNFLLKAKELNSVSALNTIGLCYLSGNNPQKEINQDLAIKYFKKAASQDYIYANNNLGNIYEKEMNYELALSYYLKSANNEESWACNKVGEFYRLGLGTDKDINKAFQYYTIGANSPIKNLYPWNIYNLITFFYLDGNPILGIERNLNKCLTLLSPIENLPKSVELLLYIYYQLYLSSKQKKDLDNVEIYLNKINNNPNISIKKKKEIQETLNNLNFKIVIPNKYQ